MGVKIQLRNDTASNWSLVNPVLAQGEVGVENDTQLMKIGNGTNNWNSLPYYQFGDGDGYLPTGGYTQTAQDLKKAVGNKYTFDKVSDMQSANYLQVGDTIELLGYYNKNDGAGHMRKIESSDDGSGIAVGSLWANYILNSNAFVEHFGAKGDGVYNDTIYIQKSINFFSKGGTLFLKNKNYLIDTCTVRSSKPLTIIGYGARIIPNNLNEFCFIIYGNFNKIFGLKFEPQGNITENSKYKAIQVKNDNLNKNSNYNLFRDLEMYNMYQGIEFNMDSLITGACYRHKIESCEIRNQTIKDWEGSFGINFEGNGLGNSSGNDSKVINTLIKGYEKNVIVKNSIATKFINTSIDGGTIGIEYNKGSNLTFVNCYLEYNKTTLNLLNLPYRVSFLECTISNTTTARNGNLLNEEQPIWISTTVGTVGINPFLYNLGYFLYLTEDGGTILTGENYIEFKENETNKEIKFKNISKGKTGFDFTGQSDVLKILGDSDIEIGTPTLSTIFKSDGNVVLPTRRHIEAVLKACNNATDIGLPQNGFIYYNTTNNVFRCRENGSYREIQTTKNGNTSSRPTGIDVGCMYYDTTLNKPIWWNGTVWRDATGTTV